MLILVCYPRGDRRLQRSIARLGAENERQRAQVDATVQIELRLLAIQNRINVQLRVFRQLYELGRELERTFDIERICHHLLEFARRELGFQRGVVLLADEAGQAQIGFGRRVRCSMLKYSNAFKVKMVQKMI